MSGSPLSTAKAKSRVARAYKDGLGSDAITERRRDLAEANIAAAIDRALASAPPLTDAQCERLADLLRGGD